MKIIKHIIFLTSFLTIAVNTEPTIIKISDISLVNYLGNHNALGLKRIDVLKEVAHSIANEWHNKKIDFSSDFAGVVLKKILRSIKKDIGQGDQTVSICLGAKSDWNRCRNQFVYTPKDESLCFITNPEKTQLVASFLHLIQRLNEYKFTLANLDALDSIINESNPNNNTRFHDLFTFNPLENRKPKTRDY